MEPRRPGNVVYSYLVYYTLVNEYNATYEENWDFEIGLKKGEALLVTKRRQGI